MGFNTSTGLGGSFSLTPMPSQTVSDNNYLDLANTANQGWAQQYLPELYAEEVERYGNRTIGGFLKMVSAEMPMESDQVVWSEQNRLHIAYKSSGAAGSATSIEVEAKANSTISLGSSNTNSLRVGNTVLVTDTATGLKTVQCYVSTSTGVASDAGTVDATLLPYKFASLSTAGFVDNEQLNIFVYGSEFAKGSASMVGELKPQFQKYDNRPIIIKDHFKISGSDTAQIGWVETTDESGQTGYSWYLKAAGETRFYGRICKRYSWNFCC